MFGKGRGHFACPRDTPRPPCSAASYFSSTGTVIHFLISFVPWWSWGSKLWLFVIGHFSYLYSQRPIFSVCLLWMWSVFSLAGSPLDKLIFLFNSCLAHLQAWSHMPISRVFCLWLYFCLILPLHLTPDLFFGSNTAWCCQSASMTGKHRRLVPCAFGTWSLPKCAQKWLPFFIRLDLTMIAHRMMEVKG